MHKRGVSNKVPSVASTGLPLVGRKWSAKSSRLYTSTSVVQIMQILLNGNGNPFFGDTVKLIEKMKFLNLILITKIKLFYCSLIQ